MAKENKREIMEDIDDEDKFYYSYWDGDGWKKVDRRRDVPDWYPRGALIKKHLRNG